MFYRFIHIGHHGYGEDSHAEVKEEYGFIPVQLLAWGFCHSAHTAGEPWQHTPDDGDLGRDLTIGTFTCDKNIQIS